MTFQERIGYIGNRFMQKRNILFIVILCFLILGVFVCLTMMNFVIKYKQDTINRNIAMRTLLVYADIEEDKSYETLKNIANIDYIGSTKYYNQSGSYAPEFDIGEMKGHVSLSPLLNKNDISILEGPKELKKGEAICPKSFYPYQWYLDDPFHTEKVLDGSKILNKKFTIQPGNNKKDITVKIIGTYDATQTFETMSTCYIHLDDFDYISPEFAFHGYGTTITGEKIEDFTPFTGRMLRINDYKNVANVKKELANLGFKIYDSLTLDIPTLQLVLYVPLFIAIIIVLISFNIIYSFIRKKVLYRKSQYGVLKSLGYQNRELLKIDTTENVFVLIISFMISFLTYILGFILIKNLVLTNFFYYNVNLTIPYIYILGIFLFLIILIIIVSRKLIKKTLKSNINMLLSS